MNPPKCLHLFFFLGLFLWAVLYIFWVGIFIIQADSFCVVQNSFSTDFWLLKFQQARLHPLGSLIAEGFVWALLALTLWKSNSPLNKNLAFMCTTISALFAAQIMLAKPFELCADTLGILTPLDQSKPPYPILMRHWSALPHALIFAYAKPLAAISTAEVLVLGKSKKLPCALFLWSTGLLLGMAWSANSPGWGELWNWDSVENLSLAVEFGLLGCFVNHILKSETALNIVLQITAFLTSCLILFQTFLLRSGLLQSLHAFSNSRSQINIWIFFPLIWLFLLVFLLIKTNTSRKKLVISTQITSIFLFLIAMVMLIVPIFLEMTKGIHFEGLFYKYSIGISIVLSLLFFFITWISNHHFIKRKVCVLCTTVLWMLTLYITSTTNEDNLLLPLETPIPVGSKTLSFEGISIQNHSNETFLQFHIKDNKQHYAQPQLFIYNKQYLATLDDVICTLAYCYRIRPRYYDANDGLQLQVIREDARALFWIFSILLLLALMLYFLYPHINHKLPPHSAS